MELYLVPNLLVSQQLWHSEEAQCHTNCIKAPDLSAKSSSKDQKVNIMPWVDSVVCL